MTNRITGTNSGIDVDAVVKASLTTEQNKIDKAYQQQKVYEYQQEQLRKIVDQCTDFYDKYLDILSSDSLMKSSAYESVSFTGDNNNVTAKGYAGADIGEYKVNVTQLASKAKGVITSTLKEGDKISVKISDKDAVEFEVVTKEDGSNEVDLAETAKQLNSKLSEAGLNVTAKYSELSGGIVLESSSTGDKQTFELKINNVDQTVIDGKDAVFEITKEGVTSPVTMKSQTNTLVVDNIEFTANKVGETTLTGKNDGTKLKDTIVNFVNDYNKLITTINEKVLESRDKNYMPLTEAQKADMTESEIKKWEEKAQTGLLKNDNDLVRIQSALKESMRTFMSGSGLNLEAIGIKPVDNYGSKNGTFTIDEDKLTKAIENNAEGVKDLFMKSASSGDKGGVLTQLQSVLKSETKSSSSALSKRIGFVGTSTENSNTLKLNISKQKTLISELQDKYSDKETALYKKYSALETMLEKLNSQSNSLYAMLNIG